MVNKQKLVKKCLHRSFMLEYCKLLPKAVGHQMKVPVPKWDVSLNCQLINSQYPLNNIVDMSIGSPPEHDCRTLMSLHTGLAGHGEVRLELAKKSVFFSFCLALIALIMLEVKLLVESCQQFYLAVTLSAKITLPSQCLYYGNSGKSAMRVTTNFLNELKAQSKGRNSQLIL